MKKIMLPLTILAAASCLGGCGKSYESLDYSKVENWYKCDYTGSKDVDTVFIYPTCVMQGEEVTKIDENREQVTKSRIYEVQASVFADCSNIYMPLYRQLAMNQVTLTTPKGLCDRLAGLQGYNDIENALDYYFEHFNNNKPFILAGHSQGSAQLFNVLTKYMQKHEDRLNKLVACYAIGFGFSKTEIAKYSNLKFATGETDTNCIISYNTFGPNHTGTSILHEPDSFAINPINWKVDETLATAAENKGSFIKGNIESNVADAKVDLAKGCIVANADTKYEVQGAGALFGTNSFHEYDYGFYYNNLKENAAKRVEAFLGKK